MKLIATAATLLALVSSTFALSCVDNDGKEVAWWLMLKLPRMSDSKDERVKGGYGFAYMDPNTKTRGDLSLYKHQMDDKKNPVALTRSLSQLVGKRYAPISEIMRLRNLRSSKTSFMLYNDQTPEKTVSASWGHSKGVLAYDGNSGIWLPHSTPEFPSDSGSSDFWFPQGETMYGQYFFCISLSKDNIENVASQMQLVHPWVYYDGFSAAHKKELPTVADIIDKVQHNKQGETKIVKFRAEGDSKTMFTHMAKNNKWNQDMWTDLVSPTLKDSMLVESWIRGSAVGQVCSPYEINDVVQLQISPPDGEQGAGFSYLGSSDHSKWGIGKSKSKSMVCMGDINRMTTQRKRGGGAICWKSPAIWNRLNRAIVDEGKC